MDTYQIEIIEPGAIRLLEDMAELDLISIKPIDSSTDPSPDNRRAEIRSLAGSWSEMSESDFSEYLIEAKRSGDEIFGRDVRI